MITQNRLQLISIVVFVQHLLFSLDRDLRVDFRCGDTAVAKDLLHGAQVGVSAAAAALA